MRLTDERQLLQVMLVKEHDHLARKRLWLWRVNRHSGLPAAVAVMLRNIESMGNVSPVDS
jgi:hypothetical protein